MSMTANRFYVTGGTLPRGAPSYVERQADRDLYEGLLQGEYCYVLHARQMGKSSLMVHTTARLRQAGVAVAAFELTALGQNLTVEQWYEGLLSRVGRGLDLEEACEEYWLAHERLAPLQRWLGALEQVVLARCPGRIVLCLDEIDCVRSLPFSSDEFFAAIRHCYNRRSEEPVLQRLTFCLLGVATPSDLIQDTRTTPFNIGRRIELTDFTETEAAPLAAGLHRRDAEDAEGEEKPGEADSHRSSRLLQRILYWTGGHPYLSQRLCQAVAEAVVSSQWSVVSRGTGKQSASPLTTEHRLLTTELVDRLCDQLFLSHRARERDDNLLFVRDRLLRGGSDVAGILSLYARARSPRQKVADDETNPLVSQLRLSGIVREEDGVLKVRNRIYARVFDRAWVEASMPDAELRRLRALAREEARKRRDAEEQRRLAEERELMVRRSLYVADMSLAQQAWELGNIARTLELLEAQRPASNQEDLRDFAWRYLWQLGHQSDAACTLAGHTDEVRGVAFSPDGATLASGSVDGSVKLWDVATRTEVARLPGSEHPAHFTAFSPNGVELVSGSVDGSVRLWDIASRQMIAKFEGPTGSHASIALSRDGRILAMGRQDGPVRLLDMVSGHAVTDLFGHMRSVISAAFSPDSKLLATGSFDSTVRLWDMGSKQEVTVFKGYHGGVFSLGFSPDGRVLASGGWDGMVRLWDLDTGQLAAVLKGHKGWVSSVVFSPDGRFLVSASDSVRLWDAATRQELKVLRGHRDWVYCAAFSPDGKHLATGSHLGMIKLWECPPRQPMGILRGHQEHVWCLAFSPDGRMLASGSYDGTVRLWDPQSEQEIGRLGAHEAPIACLAFSPDGKILASGTGAWNTAGQPGEIRVWDVPSRRELFRLSRQTTAVQSLAFSPDGSLLASRSGDGWLKLWDMAAGQEVLSLSCVSLETPSWTSVVAFSPSGRALATGSVEEEEVQVWDIPGQCKLAELQVGPGGTATLAFSPDGRTLAAGGSWGGSIMLWDVSTRKLVARLEEAAGVVYSLAFSTDGRTLAGGYLDGIVRVWDIETNRQIVTLKDHDSVVTSVAFAPDGNLLASGSADYTIRLWRAAPLAACDAEVEAAPSSR